VVAWVSYAVYAETAAGHSADSRIQTLQQQNDALRVEIDQRRREIGLSQSDSWLMQEARRLGFVLNGEKVYVPVPGGHPLPAGGGVDPGPAPSYAAPGATPTPTPQPPQRDPLATPGPPTPYVLVVPSPTPH
jgi:hypothetical protein